MKVATQVVKSCKLQCDLDAPSVTRAGGQELLQDKLLLGFVYDELRLEYDEAIKGEPMKKLITIQIHLIDPTKIINI